MRKLTGYVGAMIVVMALMGSILAGYAININGRTAIVNDYEAVTDVSGLYNYSQEKNFIEYNPASNYIGYEQAYKVPYTSAESQAYAYYKKITSGTVTFSAGTVTYNGVNYAPHGKLYDFAIVTPKSYIQNYNTLTNYQMRYYVEGSNYIQVDNSSGTVSCTLSGSNLSISVNGTPLVTYGDCPYILIRTNTSDYNYIMIQNAAGLEPPTGTITAYYNQPSDVVAISRLVPGYGESQQSLNINYGDTFYFFNSANGGFTATHNWQYTSTPILEDLYSFNANPAYYTSAWGDNNNHELQTYCTFYPSIVYGTNYQLGIKYTETNRVNNYPIEKEYSSNTQTTTLKLNLSKGMTADYSPTAAPYLGQSYFNETNTGGGRSYYDLNLYGPSYLPNRAVYKLSDLLNTISLPDGTTQIIFETGSASGETWVTLPASEGGGNDYGGRVALNKTRFGTLNNGVVSSTDTLITNTGYDGYKAVYDVASGIVDIYRYNGTKIRTSSINDTVIESIFSTGKAQGSIYNVTPYETWTTTIDSTWQYVPGNNYDTSNYLNLTIVSSGLIESYKYIDITKGISIDPTYGNDVEWNNEYENGLIQILFRAEDTFTAYHNDLIVSGNEISVSYTDGRYSVTLNDNGPVDIGTWRNIILNIDLLNGELSVIPVRTFNSYSNVALDNTSIYVGKMTDAAPTNTIEWLGTTNSFTFNIYSTQVWLNTYGVVMLNPSLNITNYFTDLRNFYRLELSNFAAVGDSITINNVTGDISENVITFNDESLIINKLDITYADGHAYVSDANTTIDLGEITDNNVYMAGVWYFKTNLERGFTTEKQVYDWDWNGFILDNTQFAIFYIGLAIAGFVIAKRFCTFHVADYAFMIMSIVIALTVRVIA